jgi:hypothetical protein
MDFASVIFHCGVQVKCLHAMYVIPLYSLPLYAFSAYEEPRVEHCQEGMWKQRMLQTKAYLLTFVLNYALSKNTAVL